jgi:hypothetical protein
MIVIQVAAKDDAKALGILLRHSPGVALRNRSYVVSADAARALTRAGLPKRYEAQVAAIITSPPYLNRYDYSRTYALELCLLTVRSHREMVDVRHSLLRSHVERREHAGKVVDLPALGEILQEIKSKPLNNDRLPVRACFARCTRKRVASGKDRGSTKSGNWRRRSLSC